MNQETYSFGDFRIMKYKKLGLTIVALAMMLTAGTNAKADLIFDIAVTATPVASTVADFQVADPDLDASTPVVVANDIAGFGGLNLTDGTISLTTANSTGFFNQADLTGTTSFADGTAIIDEAIFLRNNRGDYSSTALPTVNLSGLASLTAGDAISVTMYGVGNSATEIALFEATYGLSTLTGATDFANEIGFVTFDFVADGVTDSLAATIDFDPAVNDRAFFAGFSVSTTAVPEPSSFALLALGVCGVVARRRRR